MADGKKRLALKRDLQREDWAERAYRYLRRASGKGKLGNRGRDPATIKERRLCVLYLLNVVGCSQAEVGRHLAISREGVRRIYDAALRAAIDGTL